MDPQLFRKLAARWVVLVAVLTLAGALVGYVVSVRTTTTYEAKAMVLALGPPLQTDPPPSNFTTTETTTTVAALMTQPVEIQTVIDDLHLTDTQLALSAHVAATPERDSGLVGLAVTDPSPDRAQQIANSLVNHFVDQVSATNLARAQQVEATFQNAITGVTKTLADQEGALSAARIAKQDTTSLDAEIQLLTLQLVQLNTDFNTFRAHRAPETVRVVSAATTPTTPVSPRKTLNVLIGGLAGLVLGVGVASLREYLAGLLSLGGLAPRRVVPADSQPGASVEDHPTHGNGLGPHPVKAALPGDADDPVAPRAIVVARSGSRTD
jgi:capsular polysaccharide biosynthesis protein